MPLDATEKRSPATESVKEGKDTESGSDASGRSGTLRGGHDPRELAQRSAEVRRERAREREQEAAENALTFRQRVGVGLTRLKQAQINALIDRLAESGKSADIAALVRLADQAFGRPQDAEVDAPEDADLATLTREQRAVVRQALAALEGEAPAQDEDA